MWYNIIYLPQTSWLVHKPRVGRHLSRGDWNWADWNWGDWNCADWNWGYWSRGDWSRGRLGVVVMSGGPEFDDMIY